MTLAPATDATLDALPPHRSGTGTALAMTIRGIGGSLAGAILEALLSRGYADRLDLNASRVSSPGPPKAPWPGALAVARRTGNPQLATDASAAFVHA